MSIIVWLAICLLLIGGGGTLGYVLRMYQHRCPAVLPPRHGRRSR